MLFTLDDLSKGAERIPVKSLNRYTFKELPAFNYTKTLRVVPDILNRFSKSMVSFRFFFFKLKLFYFTN